MLDNSQFFRIIAELRGEIKPGECNCNDNIYCEYYRTKVHCDEYQSLKSGYYLRINFSALFLTLLPTILLSFIAFERNITIEQKIGAFCFIFGILFIPCWLICALIGVKLFDSKYNNPIRSLIEYNKSQLAIDKLNEEQAKLEEQKFYEELNKTIKIKSNFDPNREREKKLIDQTLNELYKLKQHLEENQQ